jgi:hypothetical protein
LRSPKSLRAGDRPRHGDGAGASADFARAMAKAEFGRHYFSDRDQEEVRRSLAKAKARKTQDLQGRSRPERKKPKQPR